MTLRLKVIIWLVTIHFMKISYCNQFTTYSCKDVVLKCKDAENSCHSIMVNVTDDLNELFLPSSCLDPEIIRIKFHRPWHDSARGAIVDQFLAPRPWYFVHYERYNWSHSCHPQNCPEDVVLVKLTAIETPLKSMADIQFPTNCSSNMMHVRCNLAFNEYGNQRGNIASSFREGSGAIFDVYAPTNAHWVEDSYCPHQANKFRCAFLAASNCTAGELQECKHIAFFATGSFQSEGIPRESFVSSLKRVTFPQPDGGETGGRYFQLKQGFNFSSAVSKHSNYDVREDMFYIAQLFRLNHDYRSRVSKMIEDYRSMNSFNDSTKCIAFHIRRGDRVLEGRDMVEHCEHIRQRCPAKDKACMQTRFDYYGLGCHTGHPFGSLNMSMYMDAVEVLQRLDARLADIRTVVVMTNDEEWAVQQSSNQSFDWTFHVLPQPPHFRGSSVTHGVVNQMHLALIRQCSAYVAHMSSAFALLAYRYMCFRHGPADDVHVGRCPAVFDFTSEWRS